MKRIKEGLKKFGSPIALLLIMIMVACLVQPVFYLNDDVTMRSILSGAYSGTPDGHAVYMQYPLTGLLALLYRIVPVIPWMDLFFCGCIWICMVFVSGNFEKKWLGSLFALVMFLPFFLYMHYTLVAALVASTAILLCCKGRSDFKVVVLLWISFMLRSQIGLLCLPFVLAAVVWQWINTESFALRVLKKRAIFLGELLLGMLLIAGINKLCYADSEWQEYLQYNETRTQLYDYTDFLSTDKYAKEPENYGMSHDEYQLLFYYNTMLDADIDNEQLQKVTDKVTEAMKQDRTPLEVLKSGVGKYYIRLRYHDAPYNYIWIGALGVLVVSFILQQKWLQVLFMGLLVLGRSSIWIYLLEKGRFPERVSFSLYIMELLLLLGMGLTGIGIQKEKLKKGILCISTCILLLLAVLLGKDTFMKVQNQREAQKEWDALKECAVTNKDITYLVDVFSAVKYADNLFSEDNNNIMLLGGWMSASPLAEEKLTVLGNKDASEVLYTNEKVRLVVSSQRDCLWLEEYFAKRFPGSRLIQEGECSFGEGSFRIYRIEK